MDVLQGADWGDVPTWVAGIATTAAVIAALAQAARANRHAGEALKFAQDEASAREVARQDELAGQARLLAVTHNVTDHGVVLFFIENHSPAPIFALKVEAAYFMGRYSPPAYSWAHFHQHVRDQGLSRPVLPAGSSHLIAIGFCDDLGKFIEARGDEFAVDVSYVDSHGVRWRRWGNVLPRRDEKYPAVHREPEYVPPRWEGSLNRSP